MGVFKPLTATAIAAVLSATSGASFAAGAYDTTDPEYVARAQAAVAAGKISEACLPSAATAPEALYKPVAEPTADLIAAATAEGELVVNSGISDAPTVDAYKAAFEARFPGITVQIASGGSATLEERLLADHATGNQQVDIAITNKIVWIAKALKEGAIEAHDVTIPGFFDVWPDGQWTWETPDGKAGVAFYRALGLAYNSDLTTGDLVPKEWADLANPAYKGQLLALDPEASATYARVWKHILDVVGEEKMRAIGENMIKNPLYSDVQPAAQVLGAGGGMVIMQMGLNVAQTMRESGAPVVAVIPETATGPQYTVVAAAAAPHPNAAKLFSHWFYSAEGQWVLSCAALGGSVAYTGNGAKTFVPIEGVPKEEMAKIKELLGL